MSLTPFSFLACNIFSAASLVKTVHAHASSVMKSFQNINFGCGFLVGVFFFIVIFNISKNTQKSPVIPIKSEIAVTEPSPISELYEHNLSDFLFNEVRILCYVFTHESNHKSKVVHVRATWGKRCNKLLFMSTKEDPEIPGIVVLPIENGRSHLWYKARHALKYVHDHHINDADWFLRADDDK
jgi:hypothetical protein